MAAHMIPDDGSPHAPTSECGCSPQRLEVAERPDGTFGPAYLHNDMSADDERQEGHDHAATGP